MSRGHAQAPTGSLDKQRPTRYALADSLDLQRPGSPKAERPPAITPPVEKRDNETVPYVPKGFVNQQAIEAGVQRAAKTLSPTVVRIRYDFGSDWTGDPSIFFRFVLADEAAKKPKLSDIAQMAELILLKEVKADEQGLHVDFNFRSRSEQDNLKEPAWA